MCCIGWDELAAGGEAGGEHERQRHDERHLRTGMNMRPIITYQIRKYRRISSVAFFFSSIICIRRDPGFFAVVLIDSIVNAYLVYADNLLPYAEQNVIICSVGLGKLKKLLNYWKFLVYAVPIQAWICVKTRRQSSHALNWSGSGEVMHDSNEHR